MSQINKGDLGRKIRDLRFKNNKSQGDLGDFLGKSHAAVSDIERGKTDLSVSDLTKISQFFEVPIEALLQPESLTPYYGSFSHSRTEIGVPEEDKIKILKAREEFRRKAKELKQQK